MAEEFKVEDIPIVGKQEFTSTKYPFGQMKVGQSFALSLQERERAASPASWFGKRNKMKFSFRKQGDGSYRCGRIK